MAIKPGIKTSEFVAAQARLIEGGRMSASQVQKSLKRTGAVLEQLSAHEPSIRHRPEKLTELLYYRAQLKTQQVALQSFLDPTHRPAQIQHSTGTSIPLIKKQISLIQSDDPDIREVEETLRETQRISAKLDPNSSDAARYLHTLFRSHETALRALAKKHKPKALTPSVPEDEEKRPNSDEKTPPKKEPLPAAPPKVQVPPPPPSAPRAAPKPKSPEVSPPPRVPSPAPVIVEPTTFDLVKNAANDNWKKSSSYIGKVYTWSRVHIHFLLTMYIVRPLWHVIRWIKGEDTSDIKDYFKISQNLLQHSILKTILGLFSKAIAGLYALLTWPLYKAFSEPTAIPEQKPVSQPFVPPASPPAFSQVRRRPPRTKPKERPILPSTSEREPPAQPVGAGLGPIDSPPAQTTRKLESEQERFLESIEKMDVGDELTDEATNDFLNGGIVDGPISLAPAQNFDEY